MPIGILHQGFTEGLDSIPYGQPILKIVSVIAVLYLFKWYFNGAVNTSERNMHSKVVMVTGGTAGIGAEVVRGLASRGAQIVLLVQQPLSDPFLVDYIEDLREQTGNELITAEHVDLTSLHSIRVFATKWVDNAPPRRLDTIVLCANTMTPMGGKAAITEDGLESTWGLNYVANFHLLSILSPALRAQPADRDVRIVFATCGAYVAGKMPDFSAKPNPKKAKGETVPTEFEAGSVYATSKLALMTFAVAFQKHLNAYVRPDKKPNNARVIMVDPGWTRTPGMRRHLSLGTLWGLALYLIMWPVWWLVLKSAEQGAQTFLHAVMEAEWGRGEGGYFLKECRKVGWSRHEISDEDLQKKLWTSSEQTIEVLEKEGAKRRAAEKKESEKAEKKEAKSTAKEANSEAKQRKGK
ncbi:hypothetical protein C7974DRAFT_403514 [Boeremia exigua]|uniref:uncharacterized protein n=1 Tax=Boeremia exigua TaxID=749465 RepID=UPI001E8EC0A7|nr:uncharacterized protein C7974DRAFT_403514 [Boeremia exigua]KAH6615220.1 hypothetical protein C7974DRAFT_403514 [Boeremia exigua]